MSPHDHPHSHHHHGAAHEHAPTDRRALLLALGLTAGFAVVEAIAGWWSNSLALIGDSGHMIMDSLALGLGALVAWISRRPPTLRHSYGLKRAEPLGALINILLMIGVVVYIGTAATSRLARPEPVNGDAVTVVAALGLVINIIAAWMLHRGEQTLNVRGAMLHVLGDLLGSVAALVAGVVISLTGWYSVDPILSLFIGLLILAGSLHLLRDALSIVMESVPQDVDLKRVGQTLADAPSVKHVHDLHVWAIDSSTYAVSAHIVIEDMDVWTTCHQELQHRLAQLGIGHATLQPEAIEAFAQECADGSCGRIFSNTQR